MFALLENPVDPFPTRNNATPATTVRRFLSEEFRPLRPVVAGAVATTILSAAIEVWLIGYAGRLVDVLAAGRPDTLWADHGLELDAPILVLDEATSALDSEAEAAIHDTLTKIMTGRTVIAIAHRLSTIAHMDRIVVLDAGRVVEQGTHTELVDRGALYADLWSRQSGGFLGTRPQP